MAQLEAFQWQQIEQHMAAAAAQQRLPDEEHEVAVQCPRDEENLVQPFAPIRVVLRNWRGEEIVRWDERDMDGPVFNFETNARIRWRAGRTDYAGRLAHLLAHHQTPARAQKENLQPDPDLPPIWRAHADSTHPFVLGTQLNGVQAAYVHPTERATRSAADTWADVFRKELCGLPNATQAAEDANTTADTHSAICAVCMHRKSAFVQCYSCSRAAYDPRSSHQCRHRRRRTRRRMLLWILIIMLMMMYSSFEHTCCCCSAAILFFRSFFCMSLLYLVSACIGMDTWEEIFRKELCGLPNANQALSHFHTSLFLSLKILLALSHFLTFSLSKILRFSLSLAHSS